MADLEYSNLSEKVLALAEARGGQAARMAANYRAAKSSAHRHKIGDALMANASGEMWLTYYQSKNGAKGGAAKSEAKTTAARKNASKPRKPLEELSPSQQWRRRTDSES